MFTAINLIFVASNTLKYGESDEILMIKQLCNHKNLNYESIMDSAFTRLTDL